MPYESKTTTTYKPFIQQNIYPAYETHGTKGILTKHDKKLGFS